MDMSDLNRYLDDRPEASVFRVHGDAFTDNELLDLEFRHIFEKTWIFLTLESSIARANDYVTTRIGRTPVLVTRNASGGIGAFVNACRHKGATVARLEQVFEQLLQQLRTPTPSQAAPVQVRSNDQHGS